MLKLVLTSTDKQTDDAKRQSAEQIGTNEKHEAARGGRKAELYLPPAAQVRSESEDSSNAESRSTPFACGLLVRKTRATQAITNTLSFHSC